ncbi:MAG: DUF2200 family protein [Kofleriaceae bacterium]|nr:DUF2200 family protein [Kofleriaceae bacterium]
MTTDQFLAERRPERADRDAALLGLANLSDEVAAIVGYTSPFTRVEDVADPLMQKVRSLDKLVDELAKGKKMESILRR